MIYCTTMLWCLPRLAFALMLMSATGALGQDAGGWLADQSNGCKVWRPVTAPDYSLKWTGPCRDGLAEGSGTALIFEKGRQIIRYDGNVKAGRFEGHGFGYFPYGSYTGDWRDGRRNGQGVQVWKDGTRYDGNWKEDKASGSGTLIDNRGTSYAGTWLSGCLRRTGGGVRPPVGVGANACPPY